jgi:enoyl-CoA hydratase
MADILLEQTGAIATVVFNRPRLRNAISLAMWQELARVTEGLAKDDSIRAVVYRGAGTEAFAAGADISEFEENRKDRESAIRYSAHTDAAYTAIRHCPKPTLAMVFGFCMGGAMAIAMACDLRFAAEGARFGIPAAKLNIVYPVEAVAQLVQLVGPAFAKDILYSGRALDAAEALRIGLVQRLSPAAELERVTADYLATVVANAPMSVRGSKVMIQGILDGLTDARRAEIQAMALEVFDTEDYREGTRAFLEKRPPRFTGR